MLNIKNLSKTKRRLLQSSFIVSIMFLGMLVVQTAQAEIPDAEIYFLQPYQFYWDDSLNPFFTSYNTFRIPTTLHSSLLNRIDGDPSRLTTNIAIGWSQIDQNTYVFELRQNAYFSDGTPITAQNVAQALIQGAEITLNRLYADVGLVSAQALDTYTVEITTTGTYYSSFEKISLLPIFHPDSNPYDENDYLIGAGPYVLEEQHRPYNISVVKNEYYWDVSNVLIDRIIFESVNTLDEAIDAINGYNPKYMNKNIILDPYWLSWSRRDEINAPYVTLDLSIHQELAFNNINPFLDEAVERVNISRLIERQGMIDRYLDELGSPAATIWRENWLGYDSSILPWNVDPTEPLLRDNTANDMTFMVPNTNPARVGWATEIVETLNNNGYNIVLEEVGWNEYLLRILQHPAVYDGDPETAVPTYDEGGYDAAFIGYSVPTDPYLGELYETGSYWNYYNFANPEFDTLVADFYETGDIAIASQIQQILHREEPTAIILNPQDVLFYSENIGGITSNALQNIIYDWTNLFLVDCPTEPITYAIEKLDLVINDTEDLFDDGIINKGQKDSLLAKLYGAIAKLQTGNDKHVKTAINKLNALLNELNALVESNQLTQWQADPLIDLIYAIISYLTITN